MTLLEFVHTLYFTVNLFYEVLLRNIFACLHKVLIFQKVKFACLWIKVVRFTDWIKLLRRIISWQRLWRSVIMAAALMLDPDVILLLVCCPSHPCSSVT